MAVYSMTGYASGRCVVPADDTRGPSALALELRSVNGRFLDLSLRLPDALRAQEPALRRLLEDGLARGKVELRASLQGAREDGLQPPTAELLRQLASLQEQVRAQLPGSAALSVADVLRLTSGTPPAPSEHLDTAVLELARTVLTQLRRAREAEGGRLVTMLLERVQTLRALANQAEPLVPQVVAAQKQRFLQRWQDALGQGATQVDAGVAQERALAEATALALRIDVAEELDRLRAHLDAIEQALHTGGRVGKRLDFLIQELHREANTLGSKSAALELSRVGVDMKVLIEQMREQVQNIE